MVTKIILYILIAIIVLAIGGYTWFLLGSNSPTVVAPNSPSPTNSVVEYINNQYGFKFSLPQDWKNYSIVTDTWKGDVISHNGQVQVNALQGPEILIRNPLWTEQKPYQDIPIMIFTTQQWNDLQSDKFHIGAAPINPSELGRNDTYIFALPARYNYAYPAGWEEVDQILKGNPLKPIQPSSTSAMHCGGNIANPPQCPAGYHCAPDPNSHLPFGDVGGICISD